MLSPALETAPTKQAPLKTQRVIPAAVGLVAVIWLILLSGWLQVTPGSVVSHRHNVIFSSDTSLWIAYIFGHLRPDLPPIHPLQIAFWRGPAQAVAAIPRLFLRSDPTAYAVPAEYIAARVLVALIAAIGVAWLAFLALRNGVRTAECLALFLMYLLFTCNTTVCLPEHFAISNGLLSVAFAVSLLVTSAWARRLILAALTLLLGGTTLTNAIFPLLAMVQSGIRSARIRAAIIVFGIPAALGIAYALYRLSWNFRYFISTYISLRIWHDPLSTGAYLFYFLVAPAIGPLPMVAARPLGLMVTYEPLAMVRYAGLPAIGAVAWLVLLWRCTRQGYRTPATRSAVLLLLGWILFNAIFHNLWGDELMVYAPHWSWALMALVVLGASQLSRRYIMVTSALMIACQIPTLLAITHAVESIPK
jgi:hypothetical protein